MMGVFVQSPRHKNDEIFVKIYANTGGRNLGYWWPKLIFNPNYLQFERVSIGTLWEDPVLLLEKNEINNLGILESYSAAPKSGVTNDQVNNY